MRAVLLVEEDTLIRELMREHLEREGYITCAVATVRIALSAARWTRFGLVLLDFNSADASSEQQLGSLRALGAPVLMMRSAPAGTVIGTQGEIEQVVWSPFDLTTLTNAVRRFLPGGPAGGEVETPRRDVTESGTYARRAGSELSRTGVGGADQGRDEREEDRISLEALGDLVLEATSAGRRR